MLTIEPHFGHQRNPRAAGGGRRFPIASGALVPTVGFNEEMRKGRLTKDELDEPGFYSLRASM
jgi:hypothetical protein